MEIIVRYETLTDGSEAPQVDLINRRSAGEVYPDVRMSLHPIDDKATDRLVDALLHNTTDFRDVTDYR